MNEYSGTYHECRELVLVLLSLRLQILKIEVAIRMRLHRNDLQAGHDCRLVNRVSYGTYVIDVNRLTAGLVP